MSAISFKFEHIHLNTQSSIKVFAQKPYGAPQAENETILIQNIYDFK